MTLVAHDLLCGRGPDHDRVRPTNELAKAGDAPAHHVANNTRNLDMVQLSAMPASHAPPEFVWTFSRFVAA